MKPPIENLKWPDEVRRVYEHDLQEMWDPTLAPHIWNQYHQTLERYFSIARGLGKSPLDILDVGCAQGTLALLLAEQGHRVIASDLRQPFLDYASSRYEQGTIRFVCGNAMETDFKASFDLIFANQILEHLVQPVEFVSHLADYLRPGGTLVLSTPISSIFATLSLRSKRWGDPMQYAARQFTQNGDGHFFAYSPEELIEVGQQAACAIFP